MIGLVVINAYRCLKTAESSVILQIDIVLVLFRDVASWHIPCINITKQRCGLLYASLRTPTESMAHFAYMYINVLSCQCHFLSNAMVNRSENWHVHVGCMVGSFVCCSFIALFVAGGRFIQSGAGLQEVGRMTRPTHADAKTSQPIRVQFCRFQRCRRQLGTELRDVQSADQSVLPI